RELEIKRLEYETKRIELEIINSSKPIEMVANEVELKKEQEKTDQLRLALELEKLKMIKEAHPEPKIRLKCPHCKYSYEQQCRLDQHIKLHKFCSKCDFTSTDNSVVQRHEARHVDDPKCPHCDFQNESKGVLVSH